jgi:hypothetical protein
MDCVAGKYNSMTTGVTACTDCGAGKASVKMGTAANAETVCVACVAGKYATTASGATTCLHCIAGKYSDVATGVTACTDCGAGKFSEKNASVCVACISGKRGNTATGATACEMIVAGAPNATTPGVVHSSVCLFFLKLALCKNTLTKYLRNFTAPTVSENTSVALSAMKYKEVVLTEKAAAVVSIALFAALGATVLGAALGGGPVNSALIDQIQFLSIVGTGEFLVCLALTAEKSRRHVYLLGFQLDSLFLMQTTSWGFSSRSSDSGIQFWIQMGQL